MNTAGISRLKIRYHVNTFGQTAENSFIDDEHAYLSAPGIFLYAAGMLHQSSVIHIKPYKYWTRISTSLNPLKDDPFTLFQLWNGKRLIPASLKSLDYNRKNNTAELWLADGISHYYKNLIMHRAALYPTENYLDNIAGEFTRLMNNHEGTDEY